MKSSLRTRLLDESRVGGRNLKRLVILGNLIAVAVVAGVIAFDVTADRARTLEDMSSDAQNIRDVLAEHTVQTFSALRGALLDASKSIDTTDLSAPPVHQLLKDKQDAITSTFAFYVLSGDGRLAATSRTLNAEEGNLSDRSMYAVHRDNPDAGLQIGAPRKGEYGYAKDRWMINVSSRLSHPDGSFAGVVAAAVSLDYLNDLYRSLEVGREGVIGLIREDSVLIARSPITDEFMGRRLDDTVLFRDLLPKNEFGVYRAPFVTDSVERFTGYRKVAGYPLVVYVGLAVGERLAGWRRRVIIDGSIAIVVVLTMIGFSHQFLHRLAERDRQTALRVDRIIKLSDVSSALMQCTTMEDILQQATDFAREIVPCHQAVTSLTDDGSFAQLIHTVSLSDKYQQWRDYDAPPNGTGIYSLVCRTNAPMRMTQAQLESHPGWKGFGEERQRHPPMRGWLAVPLVNSDGGNLGLIQVSDREEGEFTPEDEALMLELSRVASIAVQKLKSEQAEQAARGETEKAQREIETVFNSISDAVYALDSEWRFTFLNRRAEEWLQRTAADLIGRNVWEEFPEVVDTMLPEQYQKVRNESVDVAFRFYYPPLDRWFDVRAFPRDDGGLTVYFHDVSKWVTQEEQLRQAQKMEAVGQLTGGIAHDFNNILTIILGNTQLILDQTDPDHPLYRRAQVISSAADRAADLTTRLLAFSRRQTLDANVTDVAVLITNLRTMLERSLGELYEIDTVLPDELPRVMVDEGQLENAILNLTINARDAMPSGGRVFIEAAAVEIDGDYLEDHAYATPGHYVMIAVSDEGVGMSPEVRSRVFEPFFTTKETGAGTGLGLSMVYGFIKQSNGHVNIYSVPGEGTSVKLYIPCAEGDPGSVEPTVGDQRDAPKGLERILVVEDDMLVREYAADMLTAMGFSATVVADGLAALEVLEKDQDFDLLLSDVILGGGMNGRQLADRAAEICPGLRVLFMSGYPDDVILQDGRLTPGTKLLKKPFRRAELAQRLRDVLDK